MRRIASLILLSYLLSFSTYAQTTFRQIDILKSYKEAEELVNLGKYAVAQPMLIDFIQKYDNKTLDKSNLIYADAIYYKAVCEKKPFT